MDSSTGEVSRRNVIRGAGAAGVVGATAAVPGTADAAQPASGPGPAHWTKEELVDRHAVLEAGMTEQEADCWLLVNRAGARLLQLKPQHPADPQDLADEIHALQNRLLRRPTYAKYLAIRRPSRP